MIIEIKLEKLDKTLCGLARAMGDDGFEGIVIQEIISFESKKPEEWFSEDRRKEFEAKFNKELGDENVNYKIISITKLLNNSRN